MLSERQFAEWKRNNIESLMGSGFFDEEEANNIVNWFDKFYSDEPMDTFTKSLYDSYTSLPQNGQNGRAGYLTLTSIMWRSALRILDLKYHND